MKMRHLGTEQNKVVVSMLIVVSFSITTMVVPSELEGINFLMQEVEISLPILKASEVSQQG